MSEGIQTLIGMAAFAGQEMQLTSSTTSFDAGLCFDDVRFSAVPEPSVLAWLAFAGAGLDWHLRRRGGSMKPFRVPGNASRLLNYCALRRANVWVA